MDKKKTKSDDIVWFGLFLFRYDLNTWKGQLLGRLFKQRNIDSTVKQLDRLFCLLNFKWICVIIQTN